MQDIHMENAAGTSVDEVMAESAAARATVVRSASVPLFDEDTLIEELCRSRQEVEIARKQLDYVTDPLLIDHVVFRLGAAEKHLNYLFGVARSLNIHVEGIRWEWFRD